MARVRPIMSPALWEHSAKLRTASADLRVRAQQERSRALAIREQTARSRMAARELLGSLAQIDDGLTHAGGGQKSRRTAPMASQGMAEEPRSGR